MLDSLSLARDLDAAQPLAIREAALDCLVLELTAPLMRFVAAHYPSLESSDVVNETWVRVCDKVLQGRFHDQGKDVLAYVLAVAKYVMREWRRAAELRTRHECALPETFEITMPSDPIREWEDEAEFARTLALLAPTEEEQRLLRLLMEEYSFPAIAQELQLSVTSVRRQRERLLTTCKQRFTTLEETQHVAS
jgi:RNA polymerase sigma factor (sigma-70 family)